MHSQPLELIGADARADALAGCFQIGVEKVLRQRPHPQARGGDGFEKYLAVADERGACVQLMRFAGKALQLLARSPKIRGLRKPPRAERERLVGTEHQGARLSTADIE